ncbi:ribose 5-phosphate isomerase B [Ereboglobus sp. PH5-5]|uniref:ribose 5-phosphate isomerase B n=1 Tax=unclassified Ereboglobus TaxID=2626932 RepID=UPI00240554EA|nr:MULTISPECIES: ribose 5-phosphate isomerase B [unclassified Ereboglobus]MDF9826712.1 ribose 5-phosphate isomerase B [Ereboglobus sp. PH5-10]MDF9833388.1 ribose 5-phosphate isomerase B [Ereboglobus sp. PH5-5]
MTEKKSVVIGCDEAAWELKNTLKAHIKSLGYEVEDVGSEEGVSVLYPDIALAVAEAIRSGRHERGVLLCGTGIGMAMTANKVPGIRAAQAHDTFSAERARKSNNAQIVTLGARVIGPELAKMIVRAFLESEFEGARSLPKVERMAEIERAMRQA